MSSFVSSATIAAVIHLSYPLPSFANLDLTSSEDMSPWGMAWPKAKVENGEIQVEGTSHLVTERSPSSAG